MQNPHRQPSTYRMVVRAMRRLGALAIVTVGAVHLQQNLGADYRAIPTIGPLFLLNAIGSAIIGVALLLPLERVLAGRAANRAVAQLAIGAVLIAIGSLVALFVSESGSLFGFTEDGYRAAIVIAIIAEGSTVLLLAPVAAIKLVPAFSSDEMPRPRARETPSLGSVQASREALPE
jgi:hypothetical protein